MRNEVLRVNKGQEPFRAGRLCLMSSECFKFQLATHYNYNSKLQLSSHVLFLVHAIYFKSYPLHTLPPLRCNDNDVILSLVLPGTLHTIGPLKCLTAQSYGLVSRVSFPHLTSSVVPCYTWHTLLLSCRNHPGNVLLV